jgi:RNA polymerase sigma-70 factor (ECF subfamily)
VLHGAAVKAQSDDCCFDEACSYVERAYPQSGGEALVDAANRTILQNCIEKLPEAFREVLVMRDLEEMSYRQIAEVAGLPAGTVMSSFPVRASVSEECVKWAEYGV